jgi:hypothetical protein
MTPSLSYALVFIHLEVLHRFILCWYQCRFWLTKGSRIIGDYK